MSNFNFYSKYYDLLYRDKDYESESDYISSLIKKHHPDAKNIIDFGCGTGKHDFCLAKKGFEVLGTDLSKSMIDEAKRNAPNNLQNKLSFEVGNFTNYDAGKKFDVAVSLFHVLSYQTNNQDLISCISNAKKHLNTNGIFIFDFWYGPAVLTDPPVVRVKRIADKEIEVLRIAEPEIHFQRNVVDVNYEVHVKKLDDSSIQIIKEKHPMRYFFLPELEYFLSQEGFKIVSVNEWLNFSPLLPKSWNGLIICSLKN